MSFSVTPKGASAIASQIQATVDSPAVQAVKAKFAAMAAGNTPQVEPIAAEAQIGQKDTAETPADESLASEASPEVTKPKEEPLSSQFAVLARKEKALRAKVQAQDAALRAKEQAISEREAALKAKDTEYQSKYISKDKLTPDNLWSTLSEMGISYDQLTQMALNPPQKADPATQSALAALQAEIKSLKDAQDNSKKTYEEQQSSQYKQAVNQIRTEAQSMVKTDDNFEMIRETNSVSDVVELIEQTFKQDGNLLTVEQACQMVEDHLVEEALKIANSKKIQSRLKPAAVATAPQTAPVKQGMKTLTNASATQKPLSSKERAIAAFNGTLK